MTIYINQIAKAKEFAQKKHEGQIDKGGKPYILHPFRVGNALAKYGPVVEMAGYLHDTIEDTDTKYEEILVNFGPEVANTVLAVTRFDPKYKHRLPYIIRRNLAEKEKYIDFVKRSAAHPKGRLVKIADVQDNMSPERMKDLPEHEKGMIHRYRKAMKILNEKI